MEGLLSPLESNDETNSGEWYIDDDLSNTSADGSMMLLDSDVIAMASEPPQAAAKKAAPVFHNTPIVNTTPSSPSVPTPLSSGPKESQSTMDSSSPCRLSEEQQLTEIRSLVSDALEPVSLIFFGSLNVDPARHIYRRRPGSKRDLTQKLLLTSPRTSSRLC